MDYSNYAGRGFRSSLDEALKAWNETTNDGDETSHGGVSHRIADDSQAVPVMDYTGFKRKLRQYSKRRTKLRQLFDKSENDTVDSERVVSLLDTVDGATSLFPGTRKRRKPSSSATTEAGAGYRPMADDDDEETGDCPSPTHLPGLFREKQPTIAHTRGSASREASLREREGIQALLAHETPGISGYYQSRLRLLVGRFVEWRTKFWKERERFVNGNNSHALSETSDIQAMVHETLALGKAMLDLEAFCCLNTLVVRQALLRYDAFARSVKGTPMMEFYLKQVMGATKPHGDSNASNHRTTKSNKSNGTKPNLYHHELRQVLVHQEISDLAEDFVRHLELLGQRGEPTNNESEVSNDLYTTIDSKHQLGRPGKPATAMVNPTWVGMEIVLEALAQGFRTDREDLHKLMSTATSTTIPSDKGSPDAPQAPHPFGVAGNFVEAMGNRVVFGLEDQFGWYVDRTMYRGRNLTKELRFLSRWKRQARKRWSVLRGGILEGFDASNDPEGGFGIQKSQGNGVLMHCGIGPNFIFDMECDNLAQCGGGNNHASNELPDDHPTHNGDLATLSEEEETEDGFSAISGDYGDDTMMHGVSKQQRFNLFMALTGGFLYCMNYYIVEPSSTMYVNALGAQDAAGAFLIGMMPIAAFLAAIVYSVWTNTVFRQPFLLSCSLMVAGNVIYSSAFHYKSLGMALLGRFLTGLGGPKMIVRRYMADTTSVNIRTSVNALFGMVVAAGSALGPGCAIVLSRFEFILPLPGGSELWFNSMTGPGWFMAILWGVFSMALFCGFREQDRIGLAEKLQQDEMERRHQEANSTIYLEDTIPEDDTLPTKGGDDNITLPTNATPASNSNSAPTISIPPSSILRHTHSIGGESMSTTLTAKSSLSMMSECYPETTASSGLRKRAKTKPPRPPQSLWQELRTVAKHLHFPVRICMGFLFAKVFVIETLVSCTSVLSKNRYGWNIHQVGLLGCANGLFVIPLSILVGRLSLQHQDRYLMVWLLSVGMVGLSLLIDGTDLVDTSDYPRTYNKSSGWSVGPVRYVAGYFVTYLSIQSFEGIIGSALSKLIPTALACGTFNSGLLATLVDTFGRSCGDLFISLMGLLNIRQLMNLLFVPGLVILTTCLVVVRKYYDLLAV